METDRCNISFDITTPFWTCSLNIYEILYKAPMKRNRFRKGKVNHLMCVNGLIHDQIRRKWCKPLLYTSASFSSQHHCGTCRRFLWYTFSLFMWCYTNRCRITSYWSRRRLFRYFSETKNKSQWTAVQSLIIENLVLCF